MIKKFNYDVIVYLKNRKISIKKCLIEKAFEFKNTQTVLFLIVMQ